MKWPRASRRVLLWGGAVVMMMIAWTVAPLVLRRLAFFRVRQVELVGIRHLDADHILAALRLAPRASVFDDTNILADRLLAVDGIADARVVRRPPGALKVIVQEVEPIALVATGRGALAVVDGASRPLPFERVSLDLPVVHSADSGVVGVLARIQALDPVLFQTIDAARLVNRPGGDVILELGAGGGGIHRVLLSRDAGPEVIQAVVLVAKDLAAKARSYVELDGRYAGQVVVRRRGTRIA